MNQNKQIQQLTVNYIIVKKQSDTKISTMQQRLQIKQTTLVFPSKLANQHRIFSHRKNKSSNLLQKKPQIVLMKWNNFLQQYHMHKQLNSINQSLNMVGMHLKKKKQNLVIQDVPYIQSQQISIDQNRKEEQMQTSLAIKDSKTQVIKISLNKSWNSKQPSSINTSKRSFKQKESSKQKNKITISIQLTEQSKQQQQKSQNFTDEQQDGQNQQQKQTKLGSTNKNSNIQFSFQDIQHDSKQITSQASRIIQSIEVADHLRKTACFSFNAAQKQEASYSNRVMANQQNFNHLNKQIRSKKVQNLLKFQTQQEIRRQKAQKILQEDRQYLSKIMNKK